MSRFKRLALISVGCLLAAIIAALFWPEQHSALKGAAKEPFSWNSDELFAALERDFSRARDRSSEENAIEVEKLIEAIDGELSALQKDAVPAGVLQRLESLQFRLAARTPPELLARLQQTTQRVRSAVLEAAALWPTEQASVHALIYRVIYGGRAALEEALVQAEASGIPALSRFGDVPSQTPSTIVHGVRVHSGDIVLTRGGAPTSALIARGNDFPGNFSHAALVHVDEQGNASVIEALIERGLVVSTLEEFFRDKKLRILLLRPRPTLSKLSADPLAPHRAATASLHRALSSEVGYDFEMDWRDPSEVFCAEVVYHAYRTLGVELWRYRSTMSGEGLVSWLGALGVRNFTTLVPSDLEYDPQLAPVAEWRDPNELRRDRRDNAIIDALLEEAERGAELGYAWYELPAARALKAGSVLIGVFGGEPAIPMGMSATAAARVNGLHHEIFAPLRIALDEAQVEFSEQHGYEAPYWRLLDLARDAVASRRREMAPALTPSLD